MASSDKAASDDVPVKEQKVAPTYEDGHEPVGEVKQEHTYAYTDDRKLGITGAVFLILNKMIGTGIFSTPSYIFAATGSVGISLILWVIGGILTFAGLSVWLEYGLAIPRSGGEKNYLEHVYRHPKYMATCVLASQMILLGFSSGNCLAFGRFILYAAGNELKDTYKGRAIGVACATFAVTLHAVVPKWGIRLFNVLGVFKVIVLLFIVCSGFAALAGHRKVPDPENFKNAFRIESGEGYGGGGAYEYSNALLNIVYSYKGWENANYVLGEIRDPRRTLTIAAPLAVGGVTILYVLANVAYFAAIPKSELATSDAIVAGVFFKNVFGDSAGVRVLPVFVALSNLGNVLAVSFAHARLNQELGKEGLLPLSRLWGSNKPFNSPAAAVRPPSLQIRLACLTFLGCVALPPLARDHHRPARAPARPRVQLHRQPVHVPRRVDQQLRCGGVDLAALSQVGELDVGVAYVLADHAAVPGVQCVFGHCAVHPAVGGLERGWVSVLRVPRGGCCGAVDWCGVLDAVDQVLAGGQGA